MVYPKTPHIREHTLVYLLMQGRPQLIAFAAPLRALFAILVTSYIYAFGPSSPLYGGATHLTRGGQNPSYHPARWGGDALKNRIFFSFVFVEMMAWFWVWVTLREERPGVVERMRRNTRRESAKQREE
ncbi:hypothetical protein E4U40_007841 [Claviceps sp. LM458 group G5]|nr:hypothetical protein E4U40_007841 [Claviceps sp. LM458 group G5]